MDITCKRLTIFKGILIAVIKRYYLLGIRRQSGQQMMLRLHTERIAAFLQMSSYRNLWVITPHELIRSPLVIDMEKVIEEEVRNEGKRNISFEQFIQDRDKRSMIQNPVFKLHSALSAVPCDLYVKVHPGNLRSSRQTQATGAEGNDLFFSQRYRGSPGFPSKPPEFGHAWVESYVSI